MVSVTPRPLFAPEDHRHPFYSRLGGPQTVWAQMLEEKSFAPAGDRISELLITKHIQSDIYSVQNFRSENGDILNFGNTMIM